MSPLVLHEGRAPLLLSIPHAGLAVPPALSSRFTPAAQALPDTDWHVHRLYASAQALGCSVLQAHWSRYVIDLNRPPDDAPLYATPTTGLCPLTLFDGTPVYREGMAPSAAEVRQRLSRYWQPYHDALQRVLGHLLEQHPRVVLLDAHSIRSRVPRLFAGQLPDFNIGTHDGKSADAEAQAVVEACCREAQGFSWVANGRFKGGYITRHYGRPTQGVHAVQIELAQCAYMDEAPPYAYEAGRAAEVRAVLVQVLEQLIAWARASTPASSR